MSPRIKKLIGTIAIIVWIPFYAIVAMVVAVRALPHAGPLGAFVYYAVAGTLWAVPIACLFPWLYRAPKPPSHDRYERSARREFE